jgi:hypothetical protein
MGLKRRGKQVPAGEVDILLVFGITFVVVLLLFGTSLFGAGEVKPASKAKQLMGDPNTDIYAWMGMKVKEANLQDPGPYPQLSPGANPVEVRKEQIAWYFKKFHLSKHPELYAVYRETMELPYSAPPSPMWGDQLFLDPGKKYPSLVGDGRGWIYKILDSDYQNEIMRPPQLEEMHGKRCVDHLHRLDLIFQGKGNQIDWRTDAFVSSDDSKRLGLSG